MSNGNLNPLNDLSRVYLDHVAKINQNNEEIDKKRWEGELNLQMKTDAVKEDVTAQQRNEDAKYGYDKDGNSLNPKDKKKAKRWQDDDGDGKWYEKSDVDGKISKREKEEKKKAVKEHHQKDADGKVIEHDDALDEGKKKGLDGKACWDGYKLAGTKKKGGKTVDNCVKVKVKKESFSDWRTDLREIMTDEDEDQKEIKEKNVKNKIKINPKLGEAIEEIGGEVLEAYTVTKADKKGNTPAYQGYKAGKKNVKTGKPLYKAADHLKNEEVEEFDESEKVAQGARKRAQELGAARRKREGVNRGVDKNERAGYKLSQAASSSGSSLETQRTKKKRPAGDDTSQIGHYKNRDAKRTTSKTGKPLKKPVNKLSLSQRVDHHSNKALNRRDPKQNPKHTANK